MNDVSFLSFKKSYSKTHYQVIHNINQIVEKFQEKIRMGYVVKQMKKKRYGQNQLLEKFRMLRNIWKKNHAYRKSGRKKNQDVKIATQKNIKGGKLDEKKTAKPKSQNSNFSVIRKISEIGNNTWKRYKIHKMPTKNK